MAERNARGPPLLKDIELHGMDIDLVPSNDLPSINAVFVGTSPSPTMHFTTTPRSPYHTTNATILPPSSPRMPFVEDNEVYNRNEAYPFDGKDRVLSSRDDKMLPATPKSRFAIIDAPHEVRIHIGTDDSPVAEHTGLEGSPIPSKRPSFSSKSGTGTPIQNKMFTSSHSGDSESYRSFRTKSSRLIPGLEKQLSRLKDKDHCEKLDATSHLPETCSDVPSDLPAGRYFDALQGAELEELKESEDILLPKDQQWPFLLRFPISSYGICLGLSSQAILWKQLTLNPATKFLHIPTFIHVILWSLALGALIIIFFTYMLKCIFYLEAVRREYYHPVRINFFFAPWLSVMFLALGIPSMITTSVHSATWCIFMTPIFMLELKIYGQWLSGGDRRLSKVANPSTHLSIAGNFVGALLISTIGWKEVAMFFWAVGLAHYLVLFVTLYQRLPTNEVLPRDLHPVFLMFVAAPSAASLAWENIMGDFDYSCRLIYFTGLFLYFSLMVRINFFRGYKFSIAWWAYTFPMTALSLATLRYANKIRHPVTQTMATFLSIASAITVFTLFAWTLMHLFWGTLFPNDMAIAITRKRQKGHRRKNSESDGSGNYSICVDGGSQKTMKLFGCLKSVTVSDSDQVVTKIIDKSS